jgi:hypothetical protein
MVWRHTKFLTRDSSMEVLAWLERFLGSRSESWFDPSELVWHVIRSLLWPTDVIWTVEKPDSFWKTLPWDDRLAQKRVSRWNPATKSRKVKLSHGPHRMEVTIFSVTSFNRYRTSGMPWRRQKPREVELKNFVTLRRWRSMTAKSSDTKDCGLYLMGFGW